MFFSNLSKNKLLIVCRIYRVKDDIGKQIQKECSKIFPLEDNCMVRKVKLLKKPKFDLTKLMDLYRDNNAAVKTEAKNALETPAGAN